jgi:branched-chain amino acid transport system substrate-binding protein
VGALLGALVLVLGLLSASRAASAPGAIRVGVSLAGTGPGARWGTPMLQGIQLAIEDVNRRGGAGGHPLELVVRDSATPGLDTLGRQYAVSRQYAELVADPAVVAVIGPQSSLDGRAVAVLINRADLATVTPSATTFDVTDPTLAGTFRPSGRATYFRTVGTDLTQGEAMARFAHATLGVRRVVLIDDGLEFAERVVDVFARAAQALGMTVLERRQIDWIESDYRAELRQLAALKPDAAYVGVRYGVGVKLARQLPEALPGVRLLGTETLYNRAFPLQARASGAEGWYVTNVGPDPGARPAAAGWVARFRQRFGADPTTYAMTAYTATLVVADAVGRVAAGGRPVTRAAVRDAIQATRLPDAPSGAVAFDRDGDLERSIVSVYQIRGGAFYLAETMESRSVKTPP